MLRRVRIEVEEETAEACVEALWKYEHALVQQEVRRYRHLWPIVQTDAAPILEDADVWETADQPWTDSVEERSFANSELGRQISEEVIEYVEDLPGYVGRRVVRFERIDTRRAMLATTLTGVDLRGSGHVKITKTAGFDAGSSE